MTFQEKIKMLRKHKGMTLEEVGDLVGVGKSTVRKWENGDIMNMRRDKIASLAHALGVTPAYLMGWTDSEPLYPLDLQMFGKQEEEPIKSSLVISRHSVPLIDHTEAGDPIVTWVEYYTQPGEEPHADFAVLIEDDSMVPTYRKGDVVYIQKGYKVDNGKIAAVVIDDQTTLKRIYQKPDGLLMVSDNLEYEPIFAANSGYMVTRILGVPVGFTRMYQEE